MTVRLWPVGAAAPLEVSDDEADSMSSCAFQAALEVEGWAADARTFARDLEAALVAGGGTVEVTLRTLSVVDLVARIGLKGGGSGA